MAPAAAAAAPPPSSGLLAVGEHLELVAKLLKEHGSVQADLGEVDPELAANQLSAALARSGAALKQEVSPREASPKCRKSVRSSISCSTGRTSRILEHDCLHGSLSEETQETVRDEDGPEREPSKDHRVESKDSNHSWVSQMAMRHVKSIFDGNTVRRYNKPDSCASRVEWIMSHDLTEFFFGSLISINVVFMILEAQYQGASIGSDIGFYGYYGSEDFARETNAPTPLLFHYSEYVFAALFTMEIFLRLFAMGREFFYDPWMWLDTVVVVLSDITIIGLPIFMSGAVIRVLRLARLLRILRLARKIQTFDSLYLMTTALGGSLSVLLWVCVLLFVIQTLCALLLTNIIQTFHLGEQSSLTDKEKEEVFIFFGTYWRAMVSLFELMLANWPPICRMMMETLHESWSVVVVIYKLTMGFGVIAVISGVFTQATFKAAESDDQLMLRSKAQQTAVHTRKMKMLFSKMTGGTNSEIDLRTFKAFLKDEDIKMWLKAMEYDTSDAALLFYLIDKNGDGSLSVDELIEGMASLKGTARNIDIKVLLRQSLVGRLQAQDAGCGSASRVLRMLDSVPIAADAPAATLLMSHSQYFSESLVKASEISSEPPASGCR